MGQEKKREIYDNVIKFKDRHKDTYRWDHEDGLDKLLEHSNPHEKDPIPAKFQGVEFDAYDADRKSTDQEVENENTMDAGASSNSCIVNGTHHTYGMEGTVLSPLSDSAADDEFKEVDIPENDPEEIIDVNADDVTDGEQEDPTDENPGDNPIQNQDGVSNTADVTAATAD